jgi:hypothetical protein
MKTKCSTYRTEEAAGGLVYSDQRAGPAEHVAVEMLMQAAALGVSPDLLELSEEDDEGHVTRLGNAAAWLEGADPIVIISEIARRDFVTFTNKHCRKELPMILDRGLPGSAS